MSTAATTEPILDLTPGAADQVRSMQVDHAEHAGKHLRVYVEKGGCSGMQYGLVFDERRDGDLLVGTKGVTVLVDAISADYVRGAVVDYSDSLTGGGFKILNPNARQSCGCGKSFET